MTQLLQAQLWLRTWSLHSSWHVAALPPRVSGNILWEWDGGSVRCLEIWSNVPWDDF